MTRHIEIVEVGPRDGLQNEKTVLSVEDRIEFIQRLETAGARRIETVSFVNPARVPQMAGAEEVSAALPRQAGRSRIGLVLNLRGWDRAVEAGVDEANVALAASDGFGTRNQGMTVAQQLDMLGQIAERAHNSEGAGQGMPSLSATISVVWGCPFEGEVDEGQVTAMVKQIASLGIREIALADTIGVADPWTVRRRVEAAKRAAPDATLRLHFHDTRTTGLANAYAGIEAGITVLDASCGGIGGCPFAPNATGNIATEDLVYMLQRSGYETGISLDHAIETGKWLQEQLGRPVPGMLVKAGEFPPPKPVTA